MSNLTLKQLERKVSFSFAGYGHKTISIEYRGKEYKCTSTNTLATDRINDTNDNYNKDSFFTTKKQAYLSLYNECKRKNDLK